MSTYITTLKDKSSRVILPKTRTRAVYDDNNNRLDSILTGLETEIDTHKHSTADITSGTFAISRGGTGATTASGALTNLGLPTESGTWTPVLQCYTDTSYTNPTYTTNYSYAKYRMIGDLVYITCHCKYNITNAGSGYVRIGGLPFTATNGCDGQGFALRECYGAIQEGGTGVGSTGAIDDNSTKIIVRESSGSLQRQFTTGSLWIGFSGVYLKAQ